MKTRDGIVSAIIILLVIILIVVSSILIVNGKKDKASDDISDQMKAYTLTRLNRKEVHSIAIVPIHYHYPQVTKQERAS